jgi:hypothetical protein
MSYGSDNLFYLAVDLTFVIIGAKTVAVNRVVYIKYSSEMVVMQFVCRELSMVAQWIGKYFWDTL